MVSETVKQSQERSLTIEAYMRLFSEEGPFEIIDGERLPVSPNVFGHAYAIRILFLALFNYTQAESLGEVFQETTYILTDERGSQWVQGSRIPDVMFIVEPRLTTYQQQNDDWEQKPLPLVPDLVVEVVSPTDSYSMVHRKVEKYKEDGVRLIWVIDPQRNKASVHRPDSEQQTNLTGTDTLNGEDVLPGFSLPLENVFRKG